MNRSTKESPPPVDRQKVPETVGKPGQIMKASDKARNWQDTLRLMEPQIKSAMQSMTMRPDLIFQHAMNAMKYSPALMDCTTYSVAGCLMKACTLGLSLDPTLGEAYMVPFNNKNTGRKEAQFIVGYKGLMKRIIRTGKVKVPRTIIVYDGDYFDYKADPFPTYEYLPWELARRQGKTTMEGKGHVFCALFIAEHTDSRHPAIEIMFKSELDAVMRRAKAQSGPWVTDYAEMCRKTVARRGCKWLSMDDPETQEAIALDEQAELQIPQHMAALALGDDAEYEAAQEAAKQEIAAQEAAQAPPRPELPPEDDLKAQVLAKIVARTNEARGEALSWAPLDDAIVRIENMLKLGTQEIDQWPLDALNVLWEAVKP